MSNLDVYQNLFVRLALELPLTRPYVIFFVHAAMLGLIAMQLTFNTLMIVAFYRWLFNR